MTTLTQREELLVMVQVHVVDENEGQGVRLEVGGLAVGAWGVAWSGGKK